MILAGIDIGTNTLRLLIAETRVDRNGITLRPIYEDRRVTRLGEGMANSGRLSPSAMERTVRALKEFREAASVHPIDRMIGVATSAVREAGNRRPFLDRLREEIGLSVEVVSGEEEARRTLLGVRYGLAAYDRDLLVIDIGGGSTEWMVVSDGAIQQIKTVPTGVVKLTDRYPTDDPLAPADRERLTAEVETLFRPVVESIGPLPKHRFVGTAGSVTTLAALELGLTRYDPSRVQNMRLGIQRVEHWYQTLTAMPLSERRCLAGLEKGREDLIVAGTTLLRTAMRMIGADEVTVSDYGLREGILIDWAARHGARL